MYYLCRNEKQHSDPSHTEQTNSMPFFPTRRPNDDLVALQQHYDHIATASPDPDATGGSSAHGGRLLTCDLCGRVFDRPSSYTVHMRTHTGERPFACGLCGKEFAVRSNLNRHLKTTHSGEGYDGDDGEEREE